jgi:hypothetical protein
MDEISYKIEHGSYAMASGAVHKLADLVVTRFRNCQTSFPANPSSLSDNQFPEFGLLWKLVKSDNQFVSSLCCEIMVQLTEQGFIDGGALFTSLLASASQISRPGGERVLNI